MNYPTVPTSLAPVPPVSHRYRAMAQEVGQRLALTLQQLGLQPELIEKLVIVESDTMSILFVVLNTDHLQGKLQPYEQAVHQISTNLKGLPVAVSNSTGFRYAVLLSQPPDLPRKAELPELQPGKPKTNKFSARSTNSPVHNWGKRRRIWRGRRS